MSNNSENFQHSFMSKSGTNYTVTWEEQHASSFRITFIGDYYFPETEDSRDPAILKISSLLEKIGFHLEMDHSLKRGNGLVDYSLRFKKITGEDTKCVDMMSVVRTLAENA